MSHRCSLRYNLFKIDNANPDPKRVSRNLKWVSKCLIVSSLTRFIHHWANTTRCRRSLSYNLFKIENANPDPKLVLGNLEWVLDCLMVFALTKFVHNSVYMARCRPHKIPCSYTQCTQLYEGTGQDSQQNDLQEYSGAVVELHVFYLTAN